MPKRLAIISVAVVTLFAGLSWAVGRRDHQQELKELCVALNNKNSKQYKYFEGALIKGYLFTMPCLPEPGLESSCNEQQRQNSSYAVNLKDRNNKILSLPVYGPLDALEKYPFIEGATYAVCYKLNEVASEKNKENIWIVESLDMIQKIGE